MARPSFARLLVLLGVLSLGCTSDLPVVEPLPPPPPPPGPPPPPPPGAVKVAFQGEPRDGITNTALPPIKVALLDSQDRVVLRDSMDVTVRLDASPAGATLRGTVTVATRAGIAEFTDLQIDQAADGYRFIAEVSTLASDTSSSFSMAAPRPFERSVIAASNASTCALDPSGAAWCWGDNVVGQLGEGRVLSSSTPRPIAGNLRFSQMTVQPGYTDAINDYDVWSIACGLTVDGRVYCWGGIGSAFDGGDGGAPTLVSGSRMFVSIGTNLGRLCGLALGGTVWCWRLGAHEGPTQLATDLRFTELAVGGWHDCGLTASGKAYCWGASFLGNGQYNGSDTPVPVSGDHVFRAITNGEGHSCGIDDAGATWCWGAAEHPFLGDSSGQTVAAVPVRIPGGHTFRSISANRGHTCGLDADGRLWCWGDVVTQASGPEFAKIGAGGCALTPAGQAWCGSAAVPTTERFASISAGLKAICAITTDGEGRCWGHNVGGQLADGHPLRSPVPVRVLGGKTFESLSGGGDAMCGLTSSNETWCWGSVSDLEGKRTTTPQQLTGDPRFKVISVTGNNGCGIDASGRGWCWGVGATVGDGNVSGQFKAPVQIVGNLRLSAITVGEHACALATNGDAYCWGQNMWPMEGSAVPTLVEGGFKFVSITGGWYYQCALTAGGEAYCWGQNIGGQLGTTPPGSTSVPRPVTGGLRFSMISAGYGMTCGVTLEHRGYCWSADQPDNSTSSTPKPVPGDLTFTRIAVSRTGRHACGTTPDGTIYCWGANSRGQLGNGQIDSATVTVPTRVIGIRARQPYPPPNTLSAGESLHLAS